MLTENYEGLTRERDIVNDELEFLVLMEKNYLKISLIMWELTL
jgi:hypothetical protein